MFNDSKSVPGWVALILAFGGLIAFQRVSTPPAEQHGAEVKSDNRAPPSTVHSTDEGAWLLPLETFLGYSRPAKPLPVTPAPAPLRLEIHIPLLETPQAPAQSPPVPSDLRFDSEFIKRLQSQVGSLDFLIATVADPKETQSNYRFDLQLDAIHKAVGAEGLVLDGYHLPWENAKDPTEGRREPGVLLYRKAAIRASSKSESKQINDGNSATQVKSELLLVFLIGELPTTGIHKRAFVESVDRIVRLRESFTGDAMIDSSVSVVGPIFSGSSDSLATSIALAIDKHTIKIENDTTKVSNDTTQTENQVNRKKVSFQVITGSANFVNAQRFKDLAGSDTTFHSTLINGGHLRSALISYVTQNNFERTSVAWLAESSSGTGARALASGHSVENVDMYEFLFPLNIARVREVYAEQGRRQQAGQVTLGPGRYRLVIPFSETSTARDMPAMQTPQMTAPASEILLSQMLNTIRLRRIKYVVISSIDSRDPIFLAEMVRRHCPDTQLMLISPDVIQLHTEFRSVLHGTLVASTHSLNPDEQTWCFPFATDGEHKTRYRVMASQSNYGIYNAVVLLRGLERESLTLEVNANRSSPDSITTGPMWSDSPSPLPIAYGPPLEKGVCYAPPVWISRLGPTGFHPVSIEPLGPTDDIGLIRLRNIAPAANPKFNGRVPFAARLCSIFWLGAAAVYWIGSRGKSGNWSTPLNADEWTRGYLVLPQLFRASITATFICMLATWSLLMVPPMLPESSIGAIGTTLNLLHISACILMAILLVPLLLSDLWNAIQRHGQAAQENADRPAELPDQAGVLELLGYMRLLVFVVVSALIVCLAIVVCIQIEEFCNMPGRFLFWFAAWSDLWNGVSFLPALQFLAATAILLAYGMLHQVSLLRRPEVQGVPTDDVIRGGSSADLWTRLLFPLLKRYESIGFVLASYRSGQPLPAAHSGAERGSWVVLAACAVAGPAWLAYIMSQLPGTDFFSAKLPGINLPLNAVHALFLAICAYWFLRYMKLLELMRSLLRVLERPRQIDWRKAFREHKLNMPSLADLLIWPRWPRDNDAEKVRLELERLLTLPTQLAQVALVDVTREKLFVVRMQLYVRQLCFHCSRLLVGVVIGALLIFLAANSYPYHLQPLLRLTSSLILGAVAIAMIWFYIKLDRNPVISGIVGTEPHQVQLNWSLIQTLVPAVGLTVLALISQAFPDLWHWIRETIEPARRV